MFYMVYDGFLVRFYILLVFVYYFILVFVFVDDMLFKKEDVEGWCISNGIDEEKIDIVIKKKILWVDLKKSIESLVSEMVILWK